MYYLFNSPFLTIIFIVLFVVLWRRVSRLQSKVDELTKSAQYPKVPVDKSAPIQTASPLGQTVDPFDALITKQVLQAPSGSSPATATVSVTAKPKELSEEVGGRLLGKVGIIAVVIGVSFFLKYAFENNLIGVTGRLILGLLAGFTFVGAGVAVRKKYSNYGDMLSGGGIALLYLTTFASYVFYHVINQPVAFVFMFAVTVLGGVLSAFGGTIHLAVLSVLGGFLTPMLISSGTNNALGLFTYLFFIDIGILGIAFFKKWLSLNYLGFLGTMFLFISWYARFYSEQQLSLTLAFLTVIFVVYLFATIIHNIVNKQLSKGEDLFLVTVNASVYGYFSYILLLPNYHEILGFFAVILAIVYFAIAYLSWKMNPLDKLLNLYLPGISIVFLSLAMPLQFSGYWITIAWIVEALVLYYLSFATGRGAIRTFGTLVFGVGVLRYFMFDAGINYYATNIIVFNHQFVIAILIVVVSYLIALAYVRSGIKIDQTKVTAVAVFIILANVMTVYSVTREIGSYYSKASIKAFDSYNAEIKRNQYSGINDSYANDRVEKLRIEAGKVSSSLINKKNITTSFFWAFYAILLLAIGFVAHTSLLRMMGLVLFFLTAFKILVSVWSLGEIYRIIASIGFGLIALLASFGYAKYRHRLKELIQ